ncbi:carboxypeptidase-like regulatory domain-containing protein [Labilithrix luteola]|nr:carboxypeptidase-like regulatory domain-containing protein [Labilithrix luteola]
MSRHPHCHAQGLLRQPTYVRASLAVFLAIGAGCNSPSADMATGADGDSIIHQDAGAVADAPVVSVRGKVVDSTDIPVDKQRVLVVDANGVRHEAETIADGTFMLENVARPYDVTVASAAPPRAVFLGVTLTDLYLIGRRADDATVENTATVNLSVTLPACATDCSMILRASSPHSISGRGDFGWSGAAKTESRMVTLGWRVPPASAGAAETGDLEILAFEKDFSKYWHTKTTAAFTVTAGATVTAGQMTPLAIPTVSTHVAVDDSQIPAEWRRAASAYVVLASGESFNLRSENSSLISNLLLPNAPGATYQVSARATTIVNEEREPPEFRTSNVTSPRMSLTTSASLTFDEVPGVITPTLDETLSLGSTGYEWETAPNGITSVRIAGADIYTTGRKLSFTTLAALEVRPTPGVSEIDFGTGHMKATVDELVDANASTRKSIVEAANNATSQRVRYTLTQ